MTRSFCVNYHCEEQGDEAISFVFCRELLVISLEAFAKVSNVHPPQPLPSREGNTPLHPSQEGIYPLPLWERARVK
jgi:hypothetical protein